MNGRVLEQLGRFPSNTRWSLVFLASAKNLEEQQQALQELFLLYMPALRLHLTHNFKIHQDDVEDLLQGFITDKIICGTLLTNAKRSKGKFRNLLRKSLNNYVAGIFRKQEAWKRHPRNRKIVQTDDFENIIVSEDLGAKLFDVTWAREQIAEVLKLMETHYRDSNSLKTWDVFEHRLLRPILEQTSPPPCGELAARFGFDSSAKVSEAVITAKRMFASIYKRIVAGCTPDEEVEDEIRSLIEILSHTDA